MCYLGDSSRSDGNRSSRINSLQFHSFLKTMRSDELGILRQTDQTEKEIVQHHRKSHKLHSLRHKLISTETGEFKTTPASPCCTLQSELRPAAGHRSAVSPPPTLPLSSGPTGLKQFKNPIHVKWQKPFILFKKKKKKTLLLGQIQLQKFICVN